MFPFTVPGDEEQFATFQQETHKDTWGSSITPADLYVVLHSQWQVFATAFPHQAFLLHQLKSIHDNLAVVLGILLERQKGEIVHPNFHAPSFRDPVVTLRMEEDFGLMSLDPFQYFQNGNVDRVYRKAFLDLFVSLGTYRKGSLSGVMWREMGRAILENSYDAERAKLVEELTSEASAAALNAVTGPSKAQAAIWRVRRQVIVRESAMQKALARLRVLLEEDQKKSAKGSEEFDRFARARGPVRRVPNERRRARSWGSDRSSARERPGFIYDDLNPIPIPIPVREKRRPHGPLESDEDLSIEILEDGEKW